MSYRESQSFGFVQALGPERPSGVQERRGRAGLNRVAWACLWLVPALMAMWACSGARVLGQSGGDFGPPEGAKETILEVRATGPAAEVRHPATAIPVGAGGGARVLWQFDSDPDPPPGATVKVLEVRQPATTIPEPPEPIIVFPPGVKGIRDGFRVELKGDMGGKKIAIEVGPADLRDKVFFRVQNAQADIFIEDLLALPITGKVDGKERFKIEKGEGKIFYDVSGVGTDFYYWIGAELKDKRLPPGLKMTILQPVPNANNPAPTKNWIFPADPIVLQNGSGEERYFYVILVPVSDVIKVEGGIDVTILLENAGVPFRIDRNIHF